MVARLIASADPKGTFDAEYRLDGDDRLERAVVTGPFYRGAGDVTYTVDVAQYDVSQEITRPEVRDR